MERVDACAMQASCAKLLPLHQVSANVKRDRAAAIRCFEQLRDCREALLFDLLVPLPNKVLTQSHDCSLTLTFHPKIGLRFVADAIDKLSDSARTWCFVLKTSLLRYCSKRYKRKPPVCRGARVTLMQRVCLPATMPSPLAAPTSSTTSGARHQPEAYLICGPSLKACITPREAHLKLNYPKMAEIVTLV